MFCECADFEAGLYERSSVMFRGFVLSLLVAIIPTMHANGEWKPAEGPLATRWAKDVTPDNVWPEYPRPQMVRPEWTNLNGLWDYAIVAKDAPEPEQWQGKILVPFCAESALSGVMKPVMPDQALWYRRTFETPDLDDGKRLLLHFGAVDWETTVWINDKEVGRHRGGYDPFTFDVTPHVRKDSNNLVVRVWDPTNNGYQPRGKQVLNPKGIWYTGVTGIWQTAWLEVVPKAYIRYVKITPDVDEAAVRVNVDAVGADNENQVMVSASSNGTVVSSAGGKAGQDIELKILKPQLWSPDTPFLYDLEVKLRVGSATDQVRCYAGMRKIEIKKDEDGVNRLFLNGKPLFQYGPLDQGWWPDGLYTAPCDEALKHDVEVTKKHGMNMCRKHVKVEHARFYYWADKLGLLVWQDMPNGDRHIRANQPDITRTTESAENFERELKAMIDAFYNHPSVIMWVAYNEGWGQWDTPRICKQIKQWDATRLVNNASGWTDRSVGDVHDIHSYPGPRMPALEENRAAVLGEFGGLGLPLEGHLWKKEGSWGYRGFKTREELTDAYVNLLGKLHPLIGRGLSAAVYTQTSDVEIEVNGLMTYDRAQVKMDLDRAVEAARRLYLPPPIIKPLVPTSQQKPQTWRYAMDNPGAKWYAADFDDSRWKSGPGGFGTEGTPGAVVRSQWSGSDIWIRRTFTLDQVPAEVQLSVHHDEDAEVYVNGVLAAKLTGYTTDYVATPLSAAARRALKKGENVIAIHCRQTTGGQYIDAGIVQVIPPGEG
jgi:hypothetical protein